MLSPKKMPRSGKSVDFVYDNFCTKKLPKMSCDMSHLVAWKGGSSFYQKEQFHVSSLQN